MLTLNQSIKLLNNFANAHLQVNSFGEGQLEDFATSGVTNYPAMWVDYENPTLSVSAENSGVFKSVLRVYIGDRLLKDTSNLTEILSDIQLIHLDLFSYLESQVYLPMTQTILDKSDYTFNQFFDSAFDEEIAGYYVDVVLKSSFDSNRCQIPFNNSILNNL